MKAPVLSSTLAILCIAAGCSGNNEALNAASSEHTLWYDEPATLWEETLPLGNGRLGMMPDGGISEERIVLNEISMWSGSEADYANPDAAESLPQIRELLLQGRNAEAQEVMYERFVPKKPADGGTYGGYQTLGDLHIRYHNAPQDSCCYRRWLDLSTATAYTEYGPEGAGYLRKYYVSRDCDVMIIEISAERDEAVSFDVEMSRDYAGTAGVTDDGLLMISGTLDSGTDTEGVRYSAYAKVMTEGGNSGPDTDGKHICVRDADKAWIVISAATSFFEGDDYDAAAREILEKASEGYDPERQWEASVAAHKELYDRVELHIASEASQTLPTDESE